MAREFEFKEEVQSAAHLRQGGVCAICAVSLAWQYDRAHPVYPVVRSNDAVAGWRKEVDNCVILCNGCYSWTHDEDANPTTAPTPPEDFKCSHGASRGGGAHDEWAIRMMGR